VLILWLSEGGIAISFAKASIKQIGYPIHCLPGELWLPGFFYFFKYNCNSIRLCDGTGFCIGIRGTLYENLDFLLALKTKPVKYLVSASADVETVPSEVCDRVGFHFLMTDLILLL